MAEAVHEVAGRWWRFSRYEVSGDYIRPAPGATLEQYDPWQIFGHSTRQKYTPPYQGILDIGREQSLCWKKTDMRLHELIAKAKEHGLTSKERKELNAIRPERITGDVKARVAAWCSEHGLLGLLTERLDALLTPPIRKGKQKIVYHLERLTHPARQWRRVAFALDRGETLKETLLDTPHMIVRPFGVVGARLEGVDFWMRFFPTASDEADPYPTPFSEEFWRLYAEPLTDFLGAAQRLADAVERLAGAAETVATLVNDLDAAFEEWSTTGAERGETLYGLEYLHGLVGSATFGLVAGENGTFRRAWAQPSLLATYGLMIVEDLAEGRRNHRCEMCQVPFVSRARSARYHDGGCRKRAEMRRYRERRREPRGERPRQGFSDLASSSRRPGCKATSI